MSRWIDADHLRKWILSWWERTEPTSEYLKGVDILNQIDREPSIDIVRCGECKWFDSKGHCMRLTAEYGTYEDVRTDGFCSYGERSSNEKAMEESDSNPN